jgi:cytochrome c oxidase subunit 2
MCHTIGGTLAASHVGPDLTHVGSRRSIAAGTLPNTRSNLASWISDPQAIKPGSRMPGTTLSPSELNALVTYLETLK